MKRRMIGTAALALALALVLAAGFMVTAAGTYEELRPRTLLQLMIKEARFSNDSTEPIGKASNFIVSVNRTFIIEGGMTADDNITVTDSSSNLQITSITIPANVTSISGDVFSSNDARTGGALNIDSRLSMGGTLSNPAVIQLPDGGLRPVNATFTENSATWTGGNNAEAWTITRPEFNAAIPVNINSNATSHYFDVSNATVSLEEEINGITYDNGTGPYNMVVVGDSTSALVNLPTDVTIENGVYLNTVSIGEGGTGTVVNVEKGGTVDTVVIGASDVTLNNDGNVNQIIYVNCGDTRSVITGNGTVGDVQYFTSHSWGDWKTIQEPTCTAKGRKQRVCDGCGDTQELAIQPKGHTLAHHPKITATCEENGTKEYYTCSMCNGVFKDGDGNPFGSEKERIIPATGHAWGEPAYEWSEDNISCTATRVCANNPDHVETETVRADKTVSAAATCETGGGTVWTAAFTNPAFGVQTIDSGETPPLGHDWREPTYTWSEDHSACTGTRVCKRDPEHVDTLTVNAERETVTEATCETEGVVSFRATFPEDSGYAAQEIQTNIPAGHAWGEVTYTWSEDYSACTATRVCANNPEHVEQEEVTAEINTTQPDCETDGKTVYTATFQNAAFEAQTKEVVIPAAHDWGEPAYTWSEDNNTCVATRVCERNAKHVEKETVAVLITETTPAGCETAGKEVLTTTSFENKAFEIQTKEVVIPALGHDWGEPTYTWSEDNSTCTATRACARDASHPETETVSATVTESTPADCENAGKEICKTTSFANEAFEIQTKEVVITALGHDWGEPTYTWSEDYSTCTATRACANDASHPETETVSATVTESTPADCENAGKKVYTTSAFSNAAFTVQTKEVVIPALGHDWGEPEYIWSKDYSNCTAYRFCRRERSIIKDGSGMETVAATVTESTPADCENAGKKVYTTSAFSNAAFTVQTKEVEIPALGHEWGEVKYRWSEDCSTCSAVRVCANNREHVDTIQTVETTCAVTSPTCQNPGKEVYTAKFTAEGLETKKMEVEIPPKHQLTYHEAQAATCTEPGNTAYYECTRPDCGRYFSDADGKKEIQEGDWILQPLDHDLTYHEAQAATCTEQGSDAYYECTRSGCGRYFADSACEEEIYEGDWIVEPLKHDLTYHMEQASTCIKQGNTAYYECTRSGCGCYFADPEGKNKIDKDSWLLPLAAHQLTLVPASDPTETKHGNSTPYYKCGVCGRCFSDEAGNTEDLRTDSYVIHNYVDDWETEVPPEYETVDDVEYIVYYYMQVCTVCHAENKVESGREEAMFEPGD